MSALRSRFCLALLLGLATATACGANAKDKPVAGAKQSEAHTAAKPDALAQRVCEVLQALPSRRKQACCGGAGSSLAAVCTSELSAALKRGAVAVDSARVEQCRTETGAELEGCGWVTPLMPKLADACAGIIDGTLAAGASCRSSLECGDGLHCRGVTPGSAGVCAVPGEPHSRCELPADNLASFARGQDDPRHPVCDGVCLKGQCLPFVAAGGECPSTAACAPGLNCLSGHCQAKALPVLGEACSAKAECAGDAVCADGRCSMPKDAGESCKLPFECRALACDRKPGAASGVCTDACAVVRAASPL
jgi:hypothetical protein